MQANSSLILLTSARRSWRLPLTQMVNCQTQTAQFVAHATDISREGISLRGNITPPLGAYVEMNIETSHFGGEAVELKAIVVRHAVQEDGLATWACRFLEPLAFAPVEDLVF